MVLCNRLRQTLACSQRPAYGGPPATAWIAQQGPMGCCGSTIDSTGTAIAHCDSQRRQAGAPAHVAYSSSSLARQQAERQDSPASGSYVHLGLQQERINHDGSLTTAYNIRRANQLPHATTQTNSRKTAAAETAGRPSSDSQQQQQEVQRPPGVPAAAPAAPPMSQQQLSNLVDLIQSHRRVLVVTGAGCSTESNIPDYRGPTGAYTTGFTPMTHQQFVAKKENRAR